LTYKNCPLILSTGLEFRGKKAASREEASVLNDIMKDPEVRDLFKPNNFQKDFANRETFAMLMAYLFRMPEAKKLKT